MSKKIKNVRGFYHSLGGYTRLIIRISLIAVCTLLAVAIYTHTATSNPLYYEFITLSEDLLSVIKSVAIIGFVGTMIMFRIENYK